MRAASKAGGLRNFERGKVVFKVWGFYLAAPPLFIEWGCIYGCLEQHGLKWQ
jgi:hypothetical protein